MAKVITRTLKRWANTTNFFCSPNTNGNAAREEYEQLLSEFVGWKELPFYKTNFREAPESYNCDKLVVKAWYWHGSWSDPSKEVYARLYKPANLTSEQPHK